MKLTAGVVCGLLLALLTARLWLMPLPSSFWVDETATVFVVQQGAGHPSLRVAPQVPQSIYYVLPRVSQALLGFSEAAYRLPSVLAMAAALLLVAWLAARLIHPRAAWFAVFGCLALRGIDYQAADARPYALGTFIACAALWFLVRWLDSASWPDGLLFAGAASLLCRVHLIFWPFYLVFGLYASVRLARRETPVRAWRAGAVFALLALSLVPVLPIALDLLRQAGTHVVVPVPGARALLDSLKLGLVAVCGVGAWAASRLFRWRADGPPPGTASLVLIGSWWLCQPLGLFAFSRLTGASVFVSRYLWLGLPGGVLAATVLASRLIPSKKWNVVAAALACGVLLVNGQWNRPWPLHHNSDWRSAARAVNQWTQGTGAPVICPSPFIEARPPVWTPEYRLPGFLYAHLYVYPVRARTYLFPFESSPEAETFAARLSETTLLPAGRFVIYGGAGQAGYWREWFARRPEFAEWRNRSLGYFADVQVVAFENGAAAPP